jgi:hypothetical protein
MASKQTRKNKTLVWQMDGETIYICLIAFNSMNVTYIVGVFADKYIFE